MVIGTRITLMEQMGADLNGGKLVISDLT